MTTSAIIHRGRNVLPIDAIALLSGVNYGSVRKVLAAVHALQQFSGMDAQQLIDLSSLPYQSVNLHDPSQAGRASATRLLCEDLVESGRFDHLSDYLKLRRFEPI